MAIARSPQFVFIPSPIWYPFGLRDESDISFDVRPQFEQRGITFKEATVTGFDLEGREVLIGEERRPYDYLLIATGPKVDFDSIPGLGPDKNSWSICNLDHGRKTREAWDRFLEDPGPVVIGATQGSGIRKHALRSREISSDSSRFTTSLLSTGVMSAERTSSSRRSQRFVIGHDKPKAMDHAKRHWRCSTSLGSKRRNRGGD